MRAFSQFTQLAETYDASVLMAGINSEEIFSGDEINIDSVYSFVQTRNDMNFPIVVDSERTAVRGRAPRTAPSLWICSDLPLELFDKAGRRAVPTGESGSLPPLLLHSFPILRRFPHGLPLRLPLLPPNFDKCCSVPPLIRRRHWGKCRDAPYASPSELFASGFSFVLGCVSFSALRPLD